jgi:hypothetical protein
MGHPAERGMTVIRPLEHDQPTLAVLEDDPRFDEIEAVMRANLNEDRRVSGLPPVDEHFEVTAELAD